MQHTTQLVSRRLPERVTRNDRARDPVRDRLAGELFSFSEQLAVVDSWSTETHKVKVGRGWLQYILTTGQGALVVPSVSTPGDFTGPSAPEANEAFNVV